MNYWVEELVALERSALDRWIMMDSHGGLDAMTTLLAPIKHLKPPVQDPRCETIAPRVQQDGDVASTATGRSQNRN